jgi:glutaredoxin
MRIKLFRLPVLAALGLALLLACAGPAEDSPEVVIYGSDSCSICVRLREELDQSGIDYVFKDVNVDQAARNEALRKMADQAWYDGVFRTPVLEVRGELLERPTLEEVREAL